MRRGHLVLGAAGVLALLLAACGSSTPTAANNTTSTSGAPTTSSTASTSTSGTGGGATSTTAGGSTSTTSAPTTTAKATTTTAKATTTTAKATTTTGAATNVTATEVEYKITLSTNTFHPGAYVFKVVNNGTVSHGFVITGPGVNKSDQIQPPGGSEAVSVTLQAGSYEIYCPVDSHKSLGMDDHITVS